jgi:hypothetical protein
MTNKKITQNLIWVVQHVENLFYNTNQSRKVAIAIKQLFDLSLFDGSYGRDFLHVGALLIY